MGQLPPDFPVQAIFCIEVALSQYQGADHVKDQLTDFPLRLLAVQRAVRYAAADQRAKLPRQIDDLQAGIGNVAVPLPKYQEENFLEQRLSGRFFLLLVSCL